MSNLNREGSFTTTISGRVCTAVPKTSTAQAAPTNNVQQQQTAPEATVQAEPDTIPTNESAQQPSLAIPQDEPVETPANVNGNLITTIGLAPGSAGESQSTSRPEVSVVGGGNGGGSGGGAPTAVVAGSVIGGLAVVSIIAFLLWFWRKRILKRRRSTLLTPLSVVPSLGRGGGGNNNNNIGSNEKSYVIDRASLGPTPKSQKFMATFGAGVKRFRDQFSRGRDDASVDMNRGNSQFFDRDPIPQHSRNTSDASSRGGKADVTPKDRFKDWWMRLTADVNFNWRLRSDRSKENDPFAAARDMKEKKAAMGTQSDFVSLVNKSEREVQREAERRRLHKPNKGSIGSDHFLGGLNLNFDSVNDPFSDANALRHDSAKPAPLVVSQPGNPFSDANAIGGGGARGAKQPATYVAEVRRSRGQSVGVDSVYRESVQSVESFGTRRNKFRSDPFDLDRPELLNNRQKVTSSNISTAGDSVAPRLSSNTSGSGGPHKPGRAHTRADSYSSKYSSGISMGDWSDPGPDVGPAATRWDSPTEGWRSGDRKPGSRRSGSSQSSVGKAL